MASRFITNKDHNLAHEDRTLKTIIVDGILPKSNASNLLGTIPADYIKRLLAVQDKVGEGKETLIISEELQ